MVLPEYDPSRQAIEQGKNPAVEAFLLAQRLVRRYQELGDRISDEEKKLFMSLYDQGIRLIAEERTTPGTVSMLGGCTQTMAFQMSLKDFHDWLIKTDNDYAFLDDLQIRVTKNYLNLTGSLGDTGRLQT